MTFTRPITAPFRWWWRVTAPTAREAYHAQLPEGRSVRCECDRLGRLMYAGPVSEGVVVYSAKHDHTVCSGCIDAGAGLGVAE